MITKADIWSLFALGVVVGLAFYSLILAVATDSLGFWHLAQAGWLVWALSVVHRAPVGD